MPYGKDEPVSAGYGKDAPVAGSEQLPFEAALTDPYAVKPEYRPALRKQAEAVGLPTAMDVAGGAATALGEPIAGAAELFPGAVGRRGAQASRALQKQWEELAARSPVASRLGYYPATLAGLVSPTVAGKGVGVAGRALRGAGVGATYGALTPTGEETVEERYKAKAVPAGVGAVLGGGLGAVAGGVPAAAKATIGVPSRATEEVAREFEKRGYILEPGQLKADKPFYSPGFLSARIKNQTLANREASEATGAVAGKEGITDKFLNDRFKSLSGEYDKIYKEQPTFAIDRTAIQELSDVLSREQAARPGEVRPVTEAARNILQTFSQIQEQTGQPINRINVPSEEVGRILSELKKVARTASDGNDRYAAVSAISALDGSIGRQNPKVAGTLRDLNSKYRATVALQELWDAGGIKGGNISLRKLGDRSDKLRGSNLYDLGVGGRELNLAARWEGAGAAGREIGAETVLSPSKLARALGAGLGLRGRLARRYQRKLED